MISTMRRWLRWTSLYAMGLGLGSLPAGVLVLGTLVHNSLIAIAALFIYPLAIIAGLVCLVQSQVRLRWVGSGLLSAAILWGYLAQQTLAHSNL